MSRAFAPANTRPYLCAVQKASYLTPEALTTFIRTALAEDVGDGDHSSLAAIPAEERISQRIDKFSAMGVVVE